MQDIVVNMSEKFHDDRLRNYEALGDRKSDNNTKKNDVCSGWPTVGLQIGTVDLLPIRPNMSYVVIYKPSIRLHPWSCHSRPSWDEIYWVRCISHIHRQLLVRRDPSCIRNTLVFVSLHATINTYSCDILCRHLAGDFHNSCRR